MRNRHFLGLDLLTLLFIPAIAISLRLDGLDWLHYFIPALAFFTFTALVVKISVFYGFGLYRRYWRFASVDDLFAVMVAVGLSTVFLAVSFIALHSALIEYRLAMYRTVPIIDGMLTLLVVGGLRVGVRAIHYWQNRCQRAIGGRRVLVVGAGEAGTIAVNEMRANPELDMEPIAFVDDDPAKIGIHIRGLPVLGCCRDIPILVKRYQIQRIIVAMPSIPLGRQKEIIALCEKISVATHSVPGVYQILAGYKTINRLPQYDINRLLDRQPVEFDSTEVATALQGTTVLVTGAGGSIGSELCRQIARMEPESIILLGHGENSIFEITLDLQLSHPSLTTHPMIVDVRDEPGINRVIETYRPQAIFHAAAHKHVPFMEDHVTEAITTNILGTRNLLQAAEQYGVEHFVLISTDKAVNPTSIMGATKRMAEWLLVAAAQRSQHAYMAVRFGNVLGSRGSVIRVFQRQLAAGGPLTVTHPEMHRYFMTIPEAVQLVLQATVLGQGGETFVLDMDHPVRISDLATNMIKLAGLKVGLDVEIVYTGLRPGEKLNEELFLTSEMYRRTRNDRIFVTRPEGYLEAETQEKVVLELVNLATQLDPQTAAEQMRVLLPEVCYYIDQYRPHPQHTSLSKPRILLEASPQRSLHHQSSALPA